MKIEKVLNFEGFLKINEQEGSGVIGAADNIIDLFFMAYFGIVTKIGKYPDAIKDLISVGEAEDKGKKMIEVITKVANQVDPKYKEAANEMTLAVKKLKEAYEALLATDEGKKQLEKINDKIYKKIIAQQDSIKTAVSEVPKMKVNDSEKSEIYNSDSALFEKVFDKTFTEERQELIKKITPIYATVVNLAQNSPLDSLKADCLKKSKELKGFMDELGSSNEDAWEKMKRSERKNKLVAITDAVNLIPSQLQEIQTKALVQLGIDKNVQGSITSAAEAIKRAMETLGKEEGEKLDTSAEKKSEQAKEDKEGKSEEKGGDKGGDKREIVSGTVDVNNLKKSGSNRDVIKSAQEKINLLLPGDEKIKPDGLYGKNTEKAIKTISDQFSALDPSIKGLDGKKMTPEFRKFLDNFEKNKDKIAAFFKK